MILKKLCQKEEEDGWFWVIYIKNIFLGSDLKFALKIFELYVKTKYLQKRKLGPNLKLSLGRLRLNFKLNPDYMRTYSFVIS
jgi:hypothetical protein